MRTEHSALDRVMTVVRWLARLASAALAVGCAVLLVYGLSQVVSGGPSSADAGTLVSLGLIVLGAIIAWPWEGLGGAVLTVVGVVALVGEIRDGVVDGGPLLVLALGVLFLVGWGYRIMSLKRTAPPKTPREPLPTPPSDERELVTADGGSEWHPFVTI